MQNGEYVYAFEITIDTDDLELWALVNATSEREAHEIVGSIRSGTDLARLDTIVDWSLKVKSTARMQIRETD